MHCYNCTLAAINTAVSLLAPTQAAILALLVSAILIKRTLCLTELARASHTLEATGGASKARSAAQAQGSVDAEAVQLDLIPYAVASLGKPRLFGLATDRTMWDTTTPKGWRVR